tara:strand:- start:632 stop:970 length:339 start_codon:yes stop_codon:yes gene_type:complete
MAFKMKNKEVMKLAKEAGNNRISPMKANGDGKKKKKQLKDASLDKFDPRTFPKLDLKDLSGKGEEYNKRLDFDPKDYFFGPEKNKKKLNKSKRNVRPITPIKPKKIKKIDYK